MLTRANLPAESRVAANPLWLRLPIFKTALGCCANRLSLLHITPRRSLEIGSNEGIARAAAAGLGVAMLPFAVVEDLIQLGRVVEVKVAEMPGLSRSLYRLERRDRPVSPAAGAFL